MLVFLSYNLWLRELQEWARGEWGYHNFSVSLSLCLSLPFALFTLLQNKWNICLILQWAAAQLPVGLWCLTASTTAAHIDVVYIKALLQLCTNSHTYACTHTRAHSYDTVSLAGVCRSCLANEQEQLTPEKTKTTSLRLEDTGNRFRSVSVCVWVCMVSVRVSKGSMKR